MTKSQMIKVLSERSNITFKKTEWAVNLFFNTIFEALRDDKRIEIRGLGSFSTRSYKSYVGRNPRTGGKIKVPPKKLPFFKVGKELKERVNRKRRMGRSVRSKGGEIDGS